MNATVVDDAIRFTKESQEKLPRLKRISSQKEPDYDGTKIS
jgi:hypothetical protein